MTPITHFNMSTTSAATPNGIVIHNNKPKPLKMIASRQQHKYELIEFPPVLDLGSKTFSLVWCSRAHLKRVSSKLQSECGAHTYMQVASVLRCTMYVYVWENNKTFHHFLVAYNLIKSENFLRLCQWRPAPNERFCFSCSIWFDHECRRPIYGANQTEAYRYFAMRIQTNKRTNRERNPFLWMGLSVCNTNNNNSHINNNVLKYDWAENGATCLWFMARR